ncbi:VOC family protein [Halobacillus rhizosphaerae]|uniref:VOC family protein n=1 Tax=Halobacillus rhizosphaerae TaxID=3064889 RepID=UPI00398AC76F
MELLRWHHFGIEVSSLPRSKYFYKHFFNCEIETELHDKGEDAVFMKNGEVRIELVSPAGGSAGNTGSHLAIEVTALAVWVKNLKSKGLEPVEGPLRIKNYCTVFYQGPDEELIEVIEVS